MTKDRFRHLRNPDGILDHCGEHAKALAARYAQIDRAAAYPRIYADFEAAAKQDIDLTVLDIGCGSGDDAFAFAQMGHHVTAVEPSDLLDIAKEKNSSSRIQYVSDTLPDLKRVTSKPIFDAVVLGAVIQYIHPQDLRSALKRVTQNLKQGGRLYISYPNPPSRPHQYKLPLDKLMSTMQDYNHFARSMGKAPMLIDGIPQTIADKGGRLGVDGTPVMFHNIVFQKSMTLGYSA
jgi:SAM-dependent methyltransferase